MNFLKASNEKLARKIVLRENEITTYNTVISNRNSLKSSTRMLKFTQIQIKSLPITNNNTELMKSIGIKQYFIESEQNLFVMKNSRYGFPRKIFFCVSEVHRKPR